MLEKILEFDQKIDSSHDLNMKQKNSISAPTEVQEKDQVLILDLEDQ